MLVAVMVIHRSGGGILAVLRGDRIGSRIVRVAIPLALTLPLMLSLVRSYAVSTGLMSPAYASAASISFICLCVTLLALLMGWRINVLEREVRGLLQRQSDARLQESEQRYTDAIEQSINGFVIRRADGQLILVNEAYRSMTGYSREELLHLKARDMVVDQGVIERVQRLKPGESAHIETFLKRKDGSLLEVQYVTQRLRNGDLQSFLLDVSDRKRLQKAHSESEQRYAELVEQALEGITVRRPSGDYVFVNDTFCKMLGYSREDLSHMSIRDVVHPDDIETTAQIHQLGHGGHLHLKKRMRRRDGAVIHVEVSAKRLRNGDIQSTIQDVTERYAAEQRERAYAEELRQLSRRLSEAQETERRSIARELHDEVGQALTATRINLKDLQQQVGNSPLAPRLADSEAVVAELLAKVRQMSLDLHPSVLDDLGLVPALSWCVRTRTVGSELRVSLDLPEDLPRFEGIAEITLFRVFQETLSNALKHAEAKHLQVWMRQAGDRLEMRVQDDGKGFDIGAARRRALSGKSLGLLGMQERIRLAGGELILESAPEKGTETRVSLPVQAR
jgi:two-component system sensor histidine kinase UhpB